MSNKLEKKLKMVQTQQRIKQGRNPAVSVSPDAYAMLTDLAEYYEVRRAPLLNVLIQDAYEARFGEV